MECGDEVFKPLVRYDSAEEQERPFISLDAQSLLCLVRSEICVRNSIIDPVRNYCYRRSAHAKFLLEFSLHLLRMNEDAIRQPILNFQSETIEAGITRVSPAGVNIVHGKHYIFPQDFVVEHQQRSIKNLEFVVP